jgi:hypothetical protein
MHYLILKWLNLISNKIKKTGEEGGFKSGNSYLSLGFKEYPGSIP